MDKISSFNTAPAEGHRRGKAGIPTLVKIDITEEQSRGVSEQLSPVSTSSSCPSMEPDFDPSANKYHTNGNDSHSMVVSKVNPLPWKGSVQEDVPTQYDIKNTYPDPVEGLGIMPMRVEVEGSSVHSDEDLEPSPKKNRPDFESHIGDAGDLAVGMLQESQDRKDSSGKTKSAPRTVILPSQKEILEALWQAGMRSTSRKLRSLQEQAAQRTGLRMDIIHNWIHNRRRRKNQEDLVNRSTKDSYETPGDAHSDDSDLTGQVLDATSIGHLPPTTMLPSPSGHFMVIHPPQPHSVAQMTHHTGLPKIRTPGPIPMIPIVQRPGPIPITSFTQPSVISQSDDICHPMISMPGIRVRPEVSKQLESTASQTDPTEHPDVLTPFVAKIRCTNEGMTHGDFVEVDVPFRSYDVLTKSICQDLSITPKAISRLRKLPDVWVRKDSDVRRMTDNVEIEVVLKDSQI